MDEVFLPVIGFEKRYKISNHGRLFSYGGKYGKIWHEMKCSPDWAGYIPCLLRDKEKKYNCRIHQLVAKHFIPNPFGLKTVNHIDGNKANNHISNLEWVTPRENIIHAVKTGLMDFKGEKHPNSKLTNDQVYAIKYSLTKLKNTEVAKIFNMSRHQISDIRKGINWGHI